MGTISMWRVLGCLVLLTALPWARTAEAEERVALDAWSATFEGEHKVSWRHERIVERTDAPEGRRRFTRTVRKWTPVGDDLKRLEIHEESDASGRILGFKRQTHFRERRFLVSVQGLDARVRNRLGTSETARLASMPYSLPILRLLIVRGAREPGEQTVMTLDLPGQGVEETTFTMQRAEDGGWRYHEGGTVMRLDKAGHLRSQAATGEHPFGSTWPVTEETAAAMDARPDGAELEARAETHTDGILRVRPPSKAWRVRRESGDDDPPNVGLEHGADVACLAMALPFALGATAEERRARAPALARRLLTKLGEVEAAEAETATFGGIGGVRVPFAGTVELATIEGVLWLVPAPNGATVLILGAHDPTMGDDTAALLEDAFAAIEILEPTTDVAYRTVRHEDAACTASLPGTWKSRGPAGPWSGPDGSMLRVGLAPLPEGHSPTTMQRTWLAHLQDQELFERVEFLEEGDAVVDGVRARRLTIRLTSDPAEAEGIQFEMRATYQLILRDDGQAIHIVLTTGPGTGKAEHERILRSVRWTNRTGLPDDQRK